MSARGSLLVSKQFSDELMLAQLETSSIPSQTRKQFILSLEDADFRFVFLGNAMFCIIDLLLAIWKDEKRLKKKARERFP